MVELMHEYRGNVLENVHPGRVCVVDEGGGRLLSAGNADAMTYFRSASKPLQALPVLIRGLDRMYGLSDSEVTIMAGSHSGEQVHLDAILGILEKTGFSEDDLIMKPVYPNNGKARDDMIRSSLPPRKALHNCSGKHLGAMMLEKALTGSHMDYWKPGSAAQKEITAMISEMTSLTPGRIEVGVDGCGLPVFAVPQRSMALAYLKLACPDVIGDPETRAAAERIVSLMNRYPHIIDGTGTVCSLFNGDSNVVAKRGAQGVYAFGLKKERIGVSMKREDGTEAGWAFIIAEILRQLKYDNAETIEKLDKLAPAAVVNDNGIEVGAIKPVFKLEESNGGES